MSQSHQLFRFQSVITLQAPFLTQGLVPPTFGIDTALLRDLDGAPLLPGSLVAGRIRHAAAELAPLRSAEFNALLQHMGQAEDDVDTASRKRLVFGDLRLQDKATGTDKPEWADKLNARTRIAIDDEKGTVRTGAMQVIEEAAPSGAQLRFQGEGYLFAEDAKAAQSLLATSRTALRWAGQLGALAGVGFGRIVAVEWKMASPVLAAVATTNASVGSWRLDLTPNMPLCVDISRDRDNQLNSGEQIPGGAIKGALAQSMRLLSGLSAKAEINAEHCPRWPVLAKHFGALCIRHALHAPMQATRPSAVPLSLAFFDKTLICVGHQDAPHLHCDSEKKWHAPAFRPDWKSDQYGMLPAELQVKSPKKRLRVRTAIDRETGRASDAQLFSIVEVVAEPDHCWQSQIDLDDVPEAQRALLMADLQRLLGELQGGLPLLGKTKALAQASLVPLSPAQQQVKPAAQHLLTLQTPACLVFVESARSEQAMRDALAAYFHSHSDGALSYSHTYSSQRLAGGNYLQTRFRADQGWLLFERGSVFALKPTPGREAEACQWLARWQRTGMPAHGGEDWRSHPFRPQEGYGEVHVDHLIHTQLRNTVTTQALALQGETA